MSNFELSMNKVGGSVTINGQTFTGKNISISGDKVVIDGVEQTDLKPSPVINITVNGDVELVRGGNSVAVNGKVGTVSTVSGDVHCEGVHGDVQTVSGDVHCEGSITGKVSTVSGDVRSRS